MFWEPLNIIVWFLLIRDNVGIEEKEMVEFILEPWKTIVIHEIVRYDIQVLVSLHGLGVQAGQLGRPINWVNGIAFIQHTMPHRDEAIKEQIQGKLHWLLLRYAVMPKYQRAFVIKDGHITVPVIDVSESALFIELSEWLKKRKQ